MKSDQQHNQFTSELIIKAAISTPSQVALLMQTTRLLIL